MAIKTASSVSRPFEGRLSTVVYRQLSTRESATKSCVDRDRLSRVALHREADAIIKRG